MPVRFVPRSEFDRLRALALPTPQKLKVLADANRLNALSAVKRAGSGHLGSSLSAMDIVVRLYEVEMNVRELGIASPHRDVYFSSKGHDVPGLYAVLFSLGIVPWERFLRLRRKDGLDGHPDVGVPGIEANSGSLGMGISKGRGIAWAKRAQGLGGHVYVMLGDGELQEGQNYEGLRGAVNQQVNGLTLIVDHNKVQSDMAVAEIGDLGDLERKFSAFGWHVARCDGNDHEALAHAFSSLHQVVDQPKVLIADTLKGAGVSFMEHPKALQAGKGLYPWHAGAPDDGSYAAAFEEVLERVNRQIAGPLELVEPEPPELLVGPTLAVQNSLGEPVSLELAGKVGGVGGEYVVEAYGKALLELAAQRDDLVVLDADLAADCRTRAFERQVPERFIQCGIAEQDMASMAAGLARHGFVPVVNSFACFLASRANEQIYNQASERTHVVYVSHFGGLIPAGPGKSHQSLRDIGVLASLPNVTIVQPSSPQSTSQALHQLVDGDGVGVLRLVIGPSPRPFDHALPRPGYGSALHEGDEAVMFAYGPVMLHESLLAADALATQGVRLRVIDWPWLNRFEEGGVAEALGAARSVFVVEDHAPAGGLGERLASFCWSKGLTQGRSFEVFGVEGHPACGTPPEVLRAHLLDGVSLAARVWRALRS